VRSGNAFPLPSPSGGTVAVPVPGRWHAWVCCHPLDEPGEEDRMTTGYATSDDGLDGEWRGTVLAGRPGAWDARGARVTAVEAPLADESHDLRTERVDRRPG
jgi:hypothetical protein